MLGAGLLGLANEEPLRWPDLGDKTIQSQPETKKLPTCLEESLDELSRHSENLDMMIGRPIIQQYVDFKRYEMVQLRGMDPTELRELFIELF
jgi:glutamine synthetase